MQQICELPWHGWINGQDGISKCPWTSWIQFLRARFIDYPVDIIAESKSKFRDIVKTLIWLCCLQCIQFHRNEDNDKDDSWAFTRRTIRQSTLCMNFNSNDFRPNGGFAHWNPSEAFMRLMDSLAGFRIPAVGGTCFGETRGMNSSKLRNWSKTVQERAEAVAKFRMPCFAMFTSYREDVFKPQPNGTRKENNYSLWQWEPNVGTFKHTSKRSTKECALWLDHTITAECLHGGKQTNGNRQITQA